MSDVRVTAAEDDDSVKAIRKISKVRLGDAHVAKETSGDDPFQETIKSLNLTGLKSSVKRKANRELVKFNRGKAKGGGTAESTQIEIDASGYNYLDVISPPYNLNYLAALYEVSSPNFAAIKTKCATIVGLGYKFVESPATKRKMEELASKEAETVKFRKKILRLRDDLEEQLDDMNEDSTFGEVLEKVYTDYEATGQGYLEIGRTINGSIGYIGHIPATTIRVRRQRDGYVQIVTNKAVFFRNFGDTETPNPIGDDEVPNEIIAIKKYTPTNTFYGIPDIIAAKEALAGNEFASRFNLDYFENKAVPRHVIILKGAEFSTAAERSIVEFFETGLKGKNHRSLYIPLPGDTPDEKVSFEIKPVESGIQDQSFEKYRNSNLSEILMAHRVPPNKVGLSNGTSVAAALEASKTFKDQVCVPEQRRLAKKLNKIFKEMTDVFLIEFNELTLTDEDTQSKIDERYLRNQTYTPNMVLATKGLPGLKGGDSVIDLSAKTKAQEKQEQTKTTSRDSARSANTSTTAAEGRAQRGSGAKDTS